MKRDETLPSHRVLPTP